MAARLLRVRWSHDASGDRPAAPGRPVHGQGALRAVRRPAGGDRRPRPADPGRREGHRAPRRHRDRQERDHGLARGGTPAPHPGDGPEQDAGGPAGLRVQGAAARQRGRVLRLVLRLLPARGVHPAERHLHREGLLDQRGGRAAAPLGHEQPAHPSGLHRRGDASPPSTAWDPAGVRRPHGAPAGRGGVQPRQAPAGLRRHPVHAQRHRLPARHLPRARRHRRGVPGVRGASGADRDVRRRDRAPHDAPPAHRGDPHRGPGDVRLPGHALRRRSRAHGAGHRRDRGRARAAAGRARAPGQAAGGPAAAHAHDLRHRDDAPDRLAAPASRTTRGTSTGASRAARPTACSTTSPRTS